MDKKQTGFTLIELLISLALGLIVTSAAVLLLVTGQKSLSMQQGLADLQDNANFGLNLITKDMRLLNLDNDSSYINNRTSMGGVVLTSSINAEKSTDATPIPLSNLYRTIVGTTAATTLLSQSGTGLTNVQSGSTDLKSDQFVIQFTPEYVIEKQGGIEYYVGGYDCEGNELRFRRNTTNNLGKRIVVQRYFLRLDTNKNPNEPNQALALACDAGNYQPPLSDGTQSSVAIENFGDNGEIIMKRADYFRVLLGVETGSNFRYIAISDYMALASPKPRIVSAQIGILTRSAQSVGRDEVVKANQTFTVLDKTVSIKKPDDSAPKYVRQVVSQTVAMRNGLGERGS